MLSSLNTFDLVSLIENENCEISLVEELVACIPEILFCQKAYEGLVGKTFTLREDALLDYVKCFFSLEQAPSNFFVWDDYLMLHPDVADSGINPYYHYLKWGLEEGRMPRQEFSGADIKELVLDNLSLNNRYEDLFRCFESYDQKVFDAVNNSQQAMIEKLTYISLQSGVDAGVVMFDEKFYFDLIEELFPWHVPDRAYGLCHWLAIGRWFDVHFTPFYDEEVYFSKYKDLRPLINRGGGFIHFISHGVFENRVACELYDPQVILSELGLDNTKPAILEYLASAGGVVYSSLVSKEYIERGGTLYDSLLRSNEIKKRFSTGVLSEITLSVKKYAPEIALPDTIAESIVEPIRHHGASRVHDSVQSILNETGRKEYKAIILLPHCRMSGAARVAAEMSHALASIYGEGGVLILALDGSEFEYPQWFSNKVVIKQVSASFTGLGLQHKCFSLVTALRLINPDVIVNINSRIAWHLFEVYGKQLQNELDLFSYYFCWDRNENNEQVGYPSEFFVTTTDYLKGIFVDNQFLKDELTCKYCLPSVIKNKIHVLQTPADESIGFINSPDNPGRKRIFWGGRFDRQKRVDILIDIAKAMPVIDFWVWGRTVLEKDVSFDFPPNVKLWGEYESLDDVPLIACDLWLYTSMWDGLPTILIDIASRGVPIVGSQVEGTADIINDKYAWPVEDFENIEAYISVINQALSSPELRLEKTNRLASYIAENHNRKTYTEKVNNVLK